MDSEKRLLLPRQHDYSVSVSDSEKRLLLPSQGKSAPTSSTSNGGATPEARRIPTGRKFAVMSACILQQFVCIGMGYGLSVMYAELVAVLNVSRSVAALTAAFYFLTVNIGGLFITDLIRKVGSGRSIIVGSLLGSAGLFASGFSPDITGVIVLTGIVFGFGMSICYLSGFVAVSLVFGSNAGLALASLTVGSSLGQFAFPLLFNTLIESYTWRGSFMILAGFSLQCLVCGMIVYGSRRFLVVPKPSTPAEKSDVNINVKTGVCGSTYVGLLTDGVIIILLINFFLLSLTGNNEAWFIVDLCISRGMSRDQGSVAASVIGLANVFGRFCATVIRYKLPNIPTVYHWVYLCPLTAVTHFLIVYSTVFWQIIAVCGVYGFIYGITVAQAPAIMFEASGLERYPQGMALVNVMYGVGDFLSALLGGYIKDMTGSYDLAFYLATGCSVYNGVTCLIAAYYVRKRNAKTNVVESGPKYSRKARERLISSTRVYP